MVAGTKRTKPPTFQHLPLNRAKKLKQSWVQVQKIRSQWKSQKRKEGLQSSRSAILEEAGSGDEHSSAAEEDTDEKMSEADAEERGLAGTDKECGSGDEYGESEDRDSTSEGETKHPAPSHGHCYRVPTSSKRGGPVARGRGRWRGNIHHRGRRGKAEDVDQAEEKPSLRELQNQAYSRSSLHTYKSNQHRGGTHSHIPRESNRGRGAQYRGQRGRGQPDMRLRMNAMLEKIKRDIV